MKGIILAGGSGSRLYPLTVSVSKHLLAVYDKPLIYYPLSVLMLAKISDILIVCNKEHLSQYETLFLNQKSLGLNINFAIQPEPKGICDALLMGKHFIGDDDFTLILGDNIFYGSGMTHILEKAVNNNFKGATVFTYYVNDQSQFGAPQYDDFGNIKRIIEKPKKKKPGPVVTGLYTFKNEAIEFCKTIKPSARGECEVTSLLNIFAMKGTLTEQELGRGFTWFDGGSFENLFEASNFVKSVQNRHGHKVACLEEISLKNGWLEQIFSKSNSLHYIDNEYVNYLKELR